MNAEERILVFCPTGRDSALIAANLQRAEIPALVCGTWSALEEEYRGGAAAILVSEEALEHHGADLLRDLLQNQPAWSDLPVLLLLGRNGDTEAMHAIAQSIGNVTLLERPMRIASLLSAVRSALRARRRQYESRRQLEQLERAAQRLLDSERELREAHARKDEFLATLAHELRNPLAPIRNAMHLLRRRTPDPALAPLHDIIDRQLAQTVRLVDDLLEVSRISQGKVALHLETLDIASVLRGAIETSRPLIDAGRHRLTVELPTHPVHVHGDAVRLAQVFSNLLNNAAKYTEDGGHIRLGVRELDGEVEIRVQDDGIGIDPQVLPTVFDSFTQVRDANARAQGGLGIGLTLVRSLVGLHDGRVVAESAGRGQGSTFTVYLPIARAAAIAGEARPQDAPPLPSLARRVIVVDDNRDAADTLGMVLRQLGADVQITYSAADALGSLAPHSDVAIIADLGMPDIDGFELARRIRGNAENDDVKLIALSGWGQAEDRARAEAAGFDAHLTKPADIESLIATLESLPPRPTSGHHPPR
ncbi:MAG TPA: hybrid sensor histidine kinase/response regulator [Steroidobacteraceae bacterium]|nr:hybrid sensor histidine kinase/response regulator [Steroidobacteraceae bacterium]